MAALTFKHIQQRDGRWCIVDLVGKHGRVRTVPMPTWVKVAIDARAVAAGITVGPVFRSVNRGGKIRETELSEKVVWQLLRPYAEAAGVPGIAPHDLRRTTAKLCRSAGGECHKDDELAAAGTMSWPRIDSEAAGTRRNARCRVLDRTIRWAEVQAWEASSGRNCKLVTLPGVSTNAFFRVVF